MADAQTLRLACSPSVPSRPLNCTSEGQDSTVTVCQERGLEASAKATKVLSLPTLESNRIDQRSAASKLKPLSSLGVLPTYHCNFNNKADSSIVNHRANDSAVTYPSSDKLRWVKEGTSSFYCQPEPRWGCTLNAVGDQLYMFGGMGKHTLNDVNVFDVNVGSWMAVSTTGSLPHSRCCHSATVVGTNIWIFGGRGEKKLFNDLHVLSTETKTWKRHPSTKSSPEPRAGHSATLVGHTLYIFGGSTHRGKYLNQVVQLDTTTMKWSRPKLKGKNFPAGRAGHIAVGTGSMIIIFGGFNGFEYFNDLFVLSTKTVSWSRILTGGSPPQPRSGHSAVLMGKNMIVVGGCNGKQFFNDTHILDTENMTWLAKFDLERPHFAPRFQHPSTLVGNNVYIFGGTGSDTFNDMYKLQIPYKSAVNQSTVDFSEPAAPDDLPVSSSRTAQLLQDGGQGQQDYRELYLCAVVALQTEKEARQRLEVALSRAEITLLQDQEVKRSLAEERSRSERNLKAQEEISKERTRKLSTDLKLSRKKLKKAESDFSAMKRSFQGLQEQLKDLRIELTDKQSTITLLTAQNKSLKEQVDSVDAASTQTTHEHQAFQQYEREFKALRTKNRALRERAAELQRTVDAYQGDEEALKNLSLQETSRLFETHLDALRKIGRARLANCSDACTGLEAQFSDVKRENETLQKRVQLLTDTVEKQKKEMLQLQVNFTEDIRRRDAEIQSLRTSLAESYEKIEKSKMHQSLYQYLDLKCDQQVLQSLEESSELERLELLEDLHHTWLKDVIAAKHLLLQKQLEDLRRKNDELLDQQLCVVCSEQLSTIVLIPCRHRCLCRNCAGVLRKCPMCRKSIESEIATY